MDTNLIVRLFGWKATLINGDTLVMDRWKWLSKKLPVRKSKSESYNLLDVGCGSGAFTIGGASKGYKSLGLSWDKNNQLKAQKRANICQKDASFEVWDVRDLDKKKELINTFEYIICTENIEHIINDVKLMNDMNNCLVEGGVLLLTTPNKNLVPMWGDDYAYTENPIEDGGHVRLGYDEQDCISICKKTGFELISIEYCSGFFSQKITGLFRFLGKMDYLFAWSVILPLRVLPILFDKIIPYTGYSICIVAQKINTSKE